MVKVNIEWSVMLVSISLSLLSLSPLCVSESCSKGYTLVVMLKNIYGVSYIDYKYPQCNRWWECIQRTELRNPPPVLILHLKPFDSSTKKIKNYVGFPLVNFSLSNHGTLSANSPAFYILCSVTNHYGTQDSGHYIHLCRSWDGNIWCICDDQNVTKARMSGKSNAAYLLFYESGSIGRMN